MGGGCCIGDCCVVDCGFCCIFDFCSDTGCSYHPSRKTTVDHSKKIADDLAKMKERADEEGHKIGQDAFNNINIHLNQFVEELKKINENDYGGKQLNIDIPTIENEIQKLNNEVTDFVGNRLNERLLLTDPELSLILQEIDDNKRSKNFENFYNKIHKQAILDLSKKIEEVVAIQFNLVDVEIKNRLEEVNRSMEISLKEYEKSEHDKMKNVEALACKQVEYMYKATIANIISDELKTAKKRLL